MKVTIGRYPKRLSSRFHTKYMERRYGYLNWPEQSRFENMLEWLEDRVQDFYNVINWIWFDRKQQKVQVRIDPWDTYSMDTTLANIIVPMLKQLKATTHGGPYVDNRDLPEELQMSSVDQEKFKEDGTVDDNYFKRWDYIMDEMIWAFEQKVKDDAWQLEGAELDKVMKRMKNGFRLFGKYYEALWD